MSDHKRPAQSGPSVLHRDMDLRVDSDAMQTRAAEDERIPIALSSEAAVERYDWMSGDRFNEVLDHSPESIDLSYARDGMPFLLNHDTGDQIGIIEDISLGNDRKLRGLVRFSRSQRAQEIKQDIADGIRKKISVGYRVDPSSMEKSRADGASVPTWRAKRWTPMEASSVPIPADYDVGVGRSADHQHTHQPAPKAKETAMSDENRAAPGDGAAATDETTAAPAKAGVVVSGVRDRSTESGEAVTHADIAQAAEIHGMTAEVNKMLAEGKTPREILKSIATEVRERLKKGIVMKPKVELNERESKQYSFARAILSLSADPRDRDYGSFERDVSQEIQRKLPTGYVVMGKDGGFFMPTTVGTRAGLDSKTSTTGTELKFVEPGSFIDLLRNKARVLQLGATMLPGLDSPVTFPVQNGAGSATWVAENPGSDVSDTNMTFSSRSLTAKTLQSTTSFSRQLLRQGVVDVENLVRNDLAEIHALAIDAAAISGTGSSNQPQGILSNTSVGVYALGANGAAPTYSSAVGLEYTVENANANIGPMGYLSTPGIKATLKTTQQFATTNGVPVWTGGEEGQVNGYRAFSSKQVPANLTKGTSTTVCHAMLFGVWSQLYIGEWGAMEVITDPYRLKKQGMIEITSFQMLDIMLRYPEAFAVTKDALSSF
jgi:HK97 family phage major capsid protein